MHVWRNSKHIVGTNIVTLTNNDLENENKVTKIQSAFEFVLLINSSKFGEIPPIDSKDIVSTVKS